MSNPYPGITVNFGTNSFSVNYLNTQNNVIKDSNSNTPITNYEYEVRLNENKRKILILKPQYLSVFVSDMRNIMKYTESSQYIDQKTIGTYNPNLTGM
jgi:hypothetical protein